MTSFAAHLDTKIGSDNLIYCSTIQLAWNELSKTLKGQISLVPDSPLVPGLNKMDFTREHLSERYFIALADFVSSGIVNKIKKELKEKFNDTSKIDFDQLQPSDILAYAYLLKILKFSVPFDKIKNGLSFGSPAQISGNMGQMQIRGTIDAPRVQAFGIDKVRRDTEKKQRNQVRVLRYVNREDFILSFRMEEGDYMMLARTAPKDTLQETISGLQIEAPQYLDDGDVLKIPKISFDLEHHFKELTSRSVLVNGSDTGYFIMEAVQLIKFDLDEVGARLRSEAAIKHIFSSAFVEKQPRQLVADGPFLLTLTESLDKSPYFAAWFNNSELFKNEESLKNG